MGNDIDLVIPMVFPADPEWRREYRRCKGDDPTGHVRYRSWGTEELLVRCCMKYMPWLRRIHILLAQESQVQEWMRGLAVDHWDESRGQAPDPADATYQQSQSPEIRLVFHRDFIPEEYLPCFASPCIEMFLHRIPGLSEQFIYANDDMFPLSPLEPEDFFRPAEAGTESTEKREDTEKGKSAANSTLYFPCQHIKDRAYPSNTNTFERKCMWQQNMIGKPFWKRFTRTYPDTGHVFSAILKSSCEEVWRRHGKEITANLSPLRRTDRSANNWIYLLYQQYSGRYIDHLPPNHHTDQNTPTQRLVEIIRQPDAGIVCINDNEHIRDWEKRAAVVREEIRKKLGITELRNNGITETKTITKTKTENEMKIALVAIGRRENRYAREWVEHYLGLGFDHIYICDNNHDGEERFDDVLGDKIAEHTVSVHDYRNRQGVQAEAYNEIYRQYGGGYDWVAFFDFDEFLTVNSMTVKEWLAFFTGTKADTVLVNWKCYGDGGMVYDDGRGVRERFTEPLPNGLAVQYDFPENNHVKCLVRGGLDDVRFRTPHVPETARRCFTAKWQPCRRSPFQKYDFTVAALHHYTTKTIEEWMTNKREKGVGDRSKAAFDRKYKDRFFMYNEETPEKRRFIDNYTSGDSGLTVAIVHYNTPKLTRAAVLSLWKHTPGCRVVVFDNSDRLTIGGCSQWDELRKDPLITIIDNTQGQEIDFDRMLEQYPERQAFDRNMSNFGSAKHTASVDRLFDMLPDGFVLMDSDVLIRQDIMPIVDREIAASGMLRPNADVMRLLPLLCWLNVPMLREHGIRYFNGEKMWALSGVYPNNRYDTGAWLLEEIRRYDLPLQETDITEYLLHLGHASWKDKKPMGWVREHESLWK